MLISREALHLELPLLGRHETPDLSHSLAMLGFPVDAVETVEGGTVLDVDVTANRGDVQSHLGLARDLAARFRQHLSPRPSRLFENGAPGDVEIRLECEACSLYATALLELGRTSGTPEEVALFLRRVSGSAKNLAPVDASNELLHRYGHPTHAFDADCLRGALVVRWARAGERLVTLDGVERVLTEADLLIADDSGPVALAGLIGGDSTKVTEGTTRVLLESAYFDPRAVRTMSRRHGLHTDASHRFGRGADPLMAEPARDLLARRLMDWAGAKLLALWTVATVPPPPAPVRFPKEVLQRIAGEAVPMGEAAEALKALGCTSTSEPGILWVTPPSWRHDLTIAEDLAEEVLRMRGFECIGSVLPPLEGPPEPLSRAYVQRRDLSRRLANLGFHQTVTFGFVSPEMDRAFAAEDNPASGRTLCNPLGQDYSIMRSSLLPSLHLAGEHNLRQGEREVRLFEIAPAFRTRPEGPQEVMQVAILWAGTLGGEDFLNKARPVQAADLLGVLGDLGYPGSANVHELAPGMLAVELALDRFPAATERIIPAFMPISRFPSVERDVSLLVDLGQPYLPLEQAMSAALPPDVAAGARCVDVFRHKSLPAGKQAWLMRMKFQAADRTLTSAEVDAWVSLALDAARSLGAELRG